MADDKRQKPKWMKPTERQKMDRYLESKGLLNYQTKGLTQQQIASRYADAGVRLADNSRWFEDNYKDNPQGGGTVGGMQNAGGQGQAQGPVNQINPPVTDPAAYTPIPKGTREYMPAPKPYFYGTDPTTGLTVALRKPGTSLDLARDGQANWTDVFLDDRKRELQDPKFYSENRITKYPQAIQQQILADPEFQFDQLADWQKPFYKISSNPNVMASPMAIAGAKAGKLIPIPIVGPAIGAWAGFQLGKIGGQDFNMAGGFADQPTRAAKGMYLLNELTQLVEQAVAYYPIVASIKLSNDPAQQKNKEWLKNPQNREALWEASRTTYDYVIGGRSENIMPTLETYLEIAKDPAEAWRIVRETLEARSKLTTKEKIEEEKRNPILQVIGHELDNKLQFAKPGEGFILGANDPVKTVTTVDGKISGSEQISIDALYIAEQVAQGRDITDVTNEVMSRAQSSVGGQIGDFYGQMKLDPLDLLAPATSKVGQGIANVTGNKVAAAAFTGTSGIQEAASKYKSIIQTQGLVKTIDPAFRVDNMGWLGRQVAGVTTEGKVRAGVFSNKGLLDPTPKTNWFQEMTTLNPGARAELGKNLFYENMSTILSTFDKPEDAANFVRRIASGDNEVWAEMGSAIGDSPEWYTVQPALKAFTTDILDKRVTEWQTGAVNRDALLRVADILGMEPGKLIDDWAKRDTHQRDFARILEKAKQSDTPESRALLQDIADGNFKPETLKQIVGLFTGEKALPWHPGQWQALMLGDMSDHFDSWVSKMLNLKPESFTTRTAHLLKTAQSILLLGGNPGYAIQNGLSNMIHRAATGIYGYMTPGQINGWMDRFGVKPTRLSEGVGMSGEINQAGGGTIATDKDIRAAQTETKGVLAAAQRLLSSIGNKMPMTKLSSFFESVEGKQGYVIAMQNFWGQTWRRNVGFKEMSAELRAEFKKIGIDPDLIHSAIESGMNMKEMENAIYGRAQGIRARSLVHEAAQMGGITSQKAAEILEKTGVLDNLDDNLRGATTPDKVSAAFDRAYRKAQNKIDIDASRDMVARVEGVSQRLNTEGSKALVDIATDIEMMGMEKMIQHYERMGMAADSMDDLDPQIRKVTWERAYSESTDEYRRFNALRASTYLGMMKGLGLGDNPLARQLLATMGDTDTTMDNVYRYMREQRNAHFDKWRDNWDDPQQYTERDAVEYNIDKAWKKAFAREDANTSRMADLFGQQYEALFKSKETGEAARQAYEQIGKFRKEMTSRQQEFRDQQKMARVAGVPLELRQLEAKKFWGETYQYMIVEMMKVKQEAIAKLDKIAKDGAQGGLDEAEAARLNEDIAVRENEKAERVSAVFDIAETYWAQGGNRSILGAGRDKFALMNVLRNEEYGGFPDLRGLDDERLTPETVKSILNLRDAEVQAARAAASPEIAKAESRKRTAAKDVSLLRYIALAGGLNDVHKAEFPDARYPNLFKLKGFTTGFGIDEIATRLAEEGKFNIDLNKPDDLGGIKQTTELIRDALRGEKIYPIDHVASEKAINAEEVEHFAQQAEDAAVVELEKIAETQKVEPFNAKEFLDQLDAAGDAEKLDLIEKLPVGIDEGLRDFANAEYEKAVNRIVAAADQESIAESMTRSEMQIEEQQRTADVAMTRELLEEQYKDAFPKATKEQISDWMKVSDAVLGYLGKRDGKTLEQMYEKYQAVLRGEQGSLLQDGRIEPINRSLSDSEVESYARALSRAGEGELRSAIQNEASREDRIAILDAVYQINPRAAENVARQVQGILFQAAKGGVSFLDGKAIISAWEGGDISTIVHENAHVFLNMMREIAKGGDVSMLDDLGVFQDWARMEQKGNIWEAVNGNGKHSISALDDGKFGYKSPSGETRAFDTFEEAQYVLEHEMFARGFERYMTNGKAPTKALARVFKNFRNWMYKVYSVITGSAIDVGMTPEMSAFFDKMLGGEGKTEAESGAQLPMRGEKLTDVVMNETFNYGGEIKTRFEIMKDLEAKGGTRDQIDMYMAGLEKQKLRSDPLYQKNLEKLSRKTLLQSDTAPIWYSKLTQTVEQIKQNKMTVEQLRGVIKSAGVKTDEVKWMGLETFLDGKQNVTKAEVMEFLSESQIKIEEVKKESDKLSELDPNDLSSFDEDGEVSEWAQKNTPEYVTENKEDGYYEVDYEALAKDPRAIERFSESQIGDTGDTKFSEYTLPGGKNYREVLFTLPSQQTQYQSGHWKEANVLAHIRLNDRVDADGKRVLFVEEVQSDWHQAGREHEYKDPSLKEKVIDYKKTLQEKYNLRPSENIVGNSKVPEDEQYALSGMTLAADRGVPQAPFQKTWHEFVMKRVLRMAADGGYERVAWTTGEQQAARYNLTNQVDSITWKKMGAGGYDVDIQTKDGGPHGVEHLFNASPEQMQSQLGKDVTDRILSYGDSGVLKSEGDLSVGGEGMKGFYDKILSAWMDKYGKQWGVKTGSTDIAGNRVHSVDVTTAMRDSVKRGQPLFQDAVLPDADPRIPLGAYPGEPLHSEVTDEGWSQHVKPLFNNMREVALKRLENREPEGAIRDMSTEGQSMLRKYVQQTKQDMASTKLATIRWGENQRDFAMLNYSRRYGFDSQLEKFYPYQFYYTRSMMNWAVRVLDKPSWLSNYARLQRQMNRYERDIPERLRGKIQIPAAWMPDWMGDSMYIDPMKTLFPFMSFMKPFETMTRDANSQQAEAERVLQEWAADGSVPESEIAQAAKTRIGTTWERAFAEAQIRRESEINNPLDFMNTMFGPAWYLTTPWKMLTGQQNTIAPTPVLNTTRALDTVTQNTWMQPVGDLIGMIGKPEQMLRNKMGLPEFGEYGDYYVDRALANMVADGQISSEEAQIAMSERSGKNFDDARERVKYELAMRVPGSAALMAGLTAENFRQGVARMAMTAPASLFGSGLLPSGELEYRGLKQEWDEAWKMKDAGDDKAITNFFDEHPEYEAYLAKGKKPEERLRSFLVGQIWDGYMSLGTTDRKQANAEMGTLFQQAFLDSETRSYDTLDIEQLARWAQMLNKNVPNTPTTQPAIEQPTAPLQTYDPAITQITDQYFKQRTELFQNYYETEQGYFALAKSDRTRYLFEHPELKSYWDWKDKWYNAHPELVPIFKGQVFKRIDTSNWSPLLLDYVGMYAMTGEPLGSGAWKALQQQWLMAGRPYGDAQAWLDAQVVPALMYGGAQ